MVIAFIGLFVAYYLSSFLFTSCEAAKFALRSFEGLSSLAEKFVQSEGSLATLVLGNNKANILIGQLLGQMVGDVLPLWAQGLPWAIFMLFTTVVVCEYIPKAVGEARPERVLNICAPILVVSGWGMTPLVYGLTYLKKFLPKPQINEDEEELVEAAQRLDSSEIWELMAKKATKRLSRTELLKIAISELRTHADNEEITDLLKLTDEERDQFLKPLPRVVSNTKADLALRYVHDEGPQVVIDKRGREVGFVSPKVAFEWLFDHYDD